jgi:DNA primase
MEIVEQVRQAANIIEIASQYTALRARGHKHVGLCPFHSEKTPSFTVDADKQLYHCFGCGVGGDVFSLVMEKENLSFPEALKFLAERYRIPLPEQRRLSPQALKLEEQVLKLNERALAFFQKNLQSTAEGKRAQEYLKKRSVQEETIREFKIGYAQNSWDSLSSFFRSQGVSAELLEKAGLAIPGKKKGDIYDRFRGRVIFPICALTGKIVGFGGRTLFDVEPKYLNSPDTPIYTKGHLLYGLNASKDAVRQAGEIILVEGYTDYLALFQAGIKNVVASLGTALTASQVGLAARFAPRIVINYDGDAAGRTAAYRALPLCFEKGLETRVLVLPEDLDPDGYIKKYGIAAYGKIQEKAGTGIRFLLDQATRGQRLAVPEVKARILQSLMPILENIPDAVIRSEYLRDAAETLGVDENVLRRMSQPRPSEPAGDPGGEFTPAERRLLQILFENPDLRPAILAELGEADVRGLNSEPVFKIISGLFRKEKDLIFQDLQREIGPVLSRRLSQALLAKGSPATLEEARDCVCALKTKAKEDELKDLQTRIARQEKEGVNGTLAGLLKEKQDLLRQILSLRNP